MATPERRRAGVLAVTLTLLTSSIVGWVALGSDIPEGPSARARGLAAQPTQPDAPRAGRITGTAFDVEGQPVLARTEQQGALLAGQTVVVDLVPDGPYSISGRFRYSEDGTEPFDEFVMPLFLLRAEDDSIVAVGRAPEQLSGRFSFQGLTTGTYRLRIVQAESLEGDLYYAERRVVVVDRDVELPHEVFRSSDFPELWRAVEILRTKGLPWKRPARRAEQEGPIRAE